MGKQRRYTDEDLKKYVPLVDSFGSLKKALRLSPNGGNENLQGHIKRLSLDTSHWMGQAWRKGKSNLSDNRFRSKYTDEELFSPNSKIGRAVVKKRLQNDPEFIHECSVCHNTEWNKNTIPLVLDHINGVRNDNRRENLRFICPNCDAQTDTFTGRNNNKNSRYVSDLEILDLLPRCYSILQICRELGMGAHGGVYLRIKQLAEKHGIERPTRPQKHKTTNLYNACVECGSKIQRKSVRCRPCSNKQIGYNKTKHLSKRPTPSELEQAIKEENGNMCAVARRYGVSDNGVRKWKKFYGI